MSNYFGTHGDRQTAVLGIDTSNYTTSVCLLDQYGDIAFEARNVLTVNSGEHGLRQSEALYQHIVHLPDILQEMNSIRAHYELIGIGVSTKPRNHKESYMPVFRAGYLAAQSIGLGSLAPIIETSHQSGHIMAGLVTSHMDVLPTEAFLVLHLSGGTTDMLRVTKARCDFEVELLASSMDLHVGQYVDRIGVQLGLPFPAGKFLEKLASEWEDQSIPIIPSVVKAGAPSFSGPLTAAQRLQSQGIPDAAIAAAVQRSIASTIEKMIRQAFLLTGIKRILLVGGVASNMAIQNRLRQRFAMDPHGSGPLYFCDPHYASDNAFGVSHIALATISAK